MSFRNWHTAAPPGSGGRRRPLGPRRRLTLLGSILATLLLAAGLTVASAAETFLEPEVFVREAFSGQAPAPQTVWLIEDLGDRAQAILGHPPVRLRERYWRRGDRTVWVLEEVGKERPITVGWVIADNKIVSAKVLVYRESRGWEVRFPFFTRQLEGAVLEDDTGLSRQVDNITGATLSVGAMRAMARLALLLHGHVTAGG